jgi:cation:H+ antiporter
MRYRPGSRTRGTLTCANQAGNPDVIGYLIWHHCAHEWRRHDNMLIPFAAVCGGLVLLMFGADRFVDGAAATASHLGIPPLLVGLVIVGFATSAPEMLVSAVAALNGTPTLGIGNAIGSNIANIGLVLGATALIAPLTVRSTVLRREFPIMFLVLVLAAGLMWDLQLDRRDGIILLIALLLVLAGSVWLALHASAQDPLAEEYKKELSARMSARKAALWLMLGLVMLLLGSNLLVNGAVDIAHAFGISDIVIGLTIVAIGTSLPELAASVASALKNEPDIALGNVIGSNMFNALAVLSMPALIAPSRFEAIVMHRVVAYMLVLTVALFLLCWSNKGPRIIGRVSGGVLLTGFVAYQLLLFSGA